MLELLNIKKDYLVGNMKIHALKGIDIVFRDSEFVSILGPSGCGKTTLLNLIGGLDHYTDGDLIIEGISTKKYSDRDWDTYRNHRIGFIFQSYNLIPHQTILENVELALNISGVDKQTRVQRAKKALDEVGLKDQYNKKPNQLSGGQCQRVAIARALVNDPEILLADEPTGALDTVTSVQIMELIKKIAEKRLVIMVTHNPELAEKYSTRIVKLLDGEIISDSNPCDKSEILKKKKIEEKTIGNKSRLKFWSAFKLSARNLISKLKRTLMVCFAGSIGIIGVASVISVSTGVRGYINSMQDDMLSGNPITIDENALDLSKMFSSVDDATKQEIIEEVVEDGYVNVDKLIEYLIERGNMLESFSVTNDITSDYVNFIEDMPSEIYSAIVKYYGIDVSNNIFTDVKFDAYEDSVNMSLNSILTTYKEVLSETEYKDIGSYVDMMSSSFAQAPSNEEFILSQYDIISNPETSKIATEKDEIMIVVDRDTKLTDMLLTQLGYYNQEQFFNLLYKYNDDPHYNPSIDKDSFSYEELMGKTFTWYPNNQVFNKTDASNPLASFNPFTYNNISSSDWTNGVDLKVTAILRPKEDIKYGCLTSGFYHTEKFTEMIIEDSINSEIVNYINQTENKKISSFKYDMPQTGQTIYYGVTYQIKYVYKYGDDEQINGEKTCFVGQTDKMSSLIGNIPGSSFEIPTTYDLTLRSVGGVNLPSSIAIYPVDFELKDEVISYLDKWNSDETIIVDGKELTKDDRNEIIYTDNLSVIISMINAMINIVTYALVAFTSLSLVVSTVMIAIITYVSVIERVKEIGVIRSLGGRKKDVSRLFNAETFIIGGLSGLVGVGITYLLSFILNMIVGSLSGIYTIAKLNLLTAVIMVVISILLTSISGLIPAKLAAKKDPVDALRSE